MASYMTPPPANAPVHDIETGERTGVVRTGACTSTTHMTGATLHIHPLVPAAGTVCDDMRRKPDVRVAFNPFCPMKDLVAQVEHVYETATIAYQKTYKAQRLKNWFKAMVYCEQGPCPINYPITQTLGHLQFNLPRQCKLYSLRVRYASDFISAAENVNVADIARAFQLDDNQDGGQLELLKRINLLVPYDFFRATLDDNGWEVYMYEHTHEDAVFASSGEALAPVATTDLFSAYDPEWARARLAAIQVQD